MVFKKGRRVMDFILWFNMYYILPLIAFTIVPFFMLEAAGIYVLSNLLSNRNHMTLDLFKLIIRYPCLPIINDNHYRCEFWYNYDTLKPTKILLADHYKGIERVTALCHELGHYETTSVKKIVHEKIRYCLAKGKIIRNDKVGMAKDEKLAWKEAIVIAKKLNIRLDKKKAIHCLSTYGAKSAFLNKLEE
jgi:hypothetical protein